MDEKMEKLLEADGWTVQCYGPLEICHEDGSFASGQAASCLVDAYRDDQRLTTYHNTLTDIAGTARLAQGASIGEFEKRLWAQVESRAQAALDPED